MKNVKGLNHIRRMRQEDLEKTGQAYQHQQSHTRHQTTQLQQLSELYDTCQVVGGESALAWQNRSTIRDSLQHLSKIQSQQIALSTAEQNRLQKQVVKDHVQVKVIDTVIDKRVRQYRQQLSRQEQKISDEFAAQSYLRQRSLR